MLTLSFALQIIGDFGIMRLSEAQKFLMYDRVQDARRALREAEGKSLKFKKAIAQIIDQNDMTKTEFKQRVRFYLLSKCCST